MAYMDYSGSVRLNYNGGLDRGSYEKQPVMETVRFLSSMEGEYPLSTGNDFRISVY